MEDLGGIFLAPLVFIGTRVYKVSCWFRDEWQWNATTLELNRLNDYCLDDIGIKRPFDLRTDDLVRRLRAGA